MGSALLGAAYADEGFPTAFGFSPLAVVAGLVRLAGVVRRASIVVMVGSVGSRTRPIGAPTTQSPAFREAEPREVGGRPPGARHTTNASFAAEVEASISLQCANSEPRLTLHFVGAIVWPCYRRNTRHARPKDYHVAVERSFH